MSATDVPPNFITILATGHRDGYACAATIHRRHMPHAQRRSKPPGTAGPSGSVDPREVEKFSAIANEWWNPTGKFGPLHKFNPVRIAFVRQEAIAYFGRDGQSLRPFDGLTLLDIGCGGGLLSEPMARLGFAVTGADASERNVTVAGTHARAAGLDIVYRATTAEALALEKEPFDVVLNMEVVEHVADMDVFITASTSLVKPGGLMFVATINRTLKSLALAKWGAEYVLGWVPVGTHDWNKFVPPVQLRAALAHCGLNTRKTQGVSFDPVSWGWRLARDTDVNYIIVAARPSSSH
jgi:2-polyprenyl-6-hydroxyphenyl methylase/3-demethylubiquinone-9 3-methyltransferase